MGVVFILLPLILFSFYVSSRVESNLNDLATIKLQKNAKAIGMDVLGQLRHIDDLLHLFASKIPLSMADNSASFDVQLLDMPGLENVKSLAFVNSDNSIDIAKGRDSTTLAILEKLVQEPMPDDGRSMIVSGHFSNEELQVFLLVPVARDAGNKVRWLIAGLSNDYLFGFYEDVATELICIIPAGGASHFCNRIPPPTWLDKISVQTKTNLGPGNFLWSGYRSEDEITGYWTLPLMVSFVSDPWVIAVLASSNNVARNLPNYKFIVLILGGLVVLPLFLVIIWIVRRYLSPVEQLIGATRLLAAGRFDTRVSLQSKDEFEELGAAFNDMAVQLGQQFFYKNTLARLSQDLKEYSTVSAGVKAIAAELIQLTGASAFSAITMPGIGSNNSLFYLRLVSSDNTNITIMPEGPSELPVKLWSGSGAEMAATFAELGCLCPQPTDTVVLLPILVEQEIKAILAFSQANSVNELMAGFLQQVADLAASTYRDLSRQYQLRHQAEHDVLTGLPNRNLLNDTVTQAIQDSLKNDDCCGLIIFDIDRFKLINDTKGHLAGDELLRQVAERLLNNSYDFSMVSRMAGDEFVILLRGLVSTQAGELVRQATEQVISIFNDPFTIGNWQVPVSCSVGATICPQDGTSFFELLQHADTAMYSAKDLGLGQVAFYTQELEDEIQQQVALENDLRDGLLNDQLVIHYQPVIDLQNHRIMSAEALVRWQHPERGLLSPFIFLGIAEKMGLLSDIGHWVLDKVLDDLRRWRSQGYDLSFVAVNVSGTEFSQEGFVEHIIKAVDSYGMSPSDIELEVTETEVIVDMENGVQKINALRDAGFRVSLDDFGTGYSSMEYLKMISVDKVKVDRTFVKDLDESSRDLIIVKALYTLANEMGLSIIAEGVETKSQLDILQGQGINLIQGFYFSQPLPDTVFLEYLTTFGNKTASKI